MYREAAATRRITKEKRLGFETATYIKYILRSIYEHNIYIYNYKKDFVKTSVEGDFHTYR